ncbi:MAG: AI-2E family transporter [Chloroflexota bacterium]|nr:AI-2E family transporter [Chloroflexota bacterium]
MLRLGTFWNRATARLRPAPTTEPSFEDEVLDVAEDLVPTPIYISQRTRLVLLAAIVGIVVWLFMEAPSVPRLLLIGSTVALILSFPVRLLQHWMPRGLAILIVMGSTVAMAIVGLILIIPFAIKEITNFVEQLPDIAATLEDSLREVLWEFRLRGWIDQNPDQVIEDAQGNLLDRGQVLTETLLNNALETLTRSFSIAITSFGVIFIATYLLIDIPRFKQKFVFSFSPAYRPDAAQLWSTIGESLSRYLSGLMVSIIIQGAMATIALTVLDVPYAIVLGLWMSATAILPYVGAFLGGIPAVLIALTISWQMAAIVAGVYVVINQVEGNLITPKIQGTAVRVHPLLIFISVIGGSQIAGPLGAILAVPTLAVVRVFAEFLWLRLQVPEAQGQDTVLVALGGEDDDHDGLPDALEEGDGDGDINIEARDDAEVHIDAGNRDITVRAEDQATVRTRGTADEAHLPNGKPIPDAPPAYSSFRPRPTVKRRAVPRKHHSRPRMLA